MTEAAQTFTFETEAKQILDLMTHSVYSNREIFLRELISNSSDAMDKRRFAGIENKELLPEGEELHVRIESDAEARTLTIVDNGIGMSRDEVIENIGTIARSGTKKFIEALGETQESLAPPDLIGQFGVGFYSVFMVADRVELVTRRAGEETATRWSSTGDGSYQLEAAERDEVGTTIKLELKDTDKDDGQFDFAGEWTIRETIKKYSDFVAYPIKMDVERNEPELDDEGQPKPDSEKKVIKTETLNSMKALWMRSKSEVEEDEYNEFYRHISHDWNPPLRTITLKAEGTYEYRALLFIPSKRPMNLFQQDFKSGLKLYVRRVFIMDDCSELLPEYLRFVRGVVDAEDLSLNISREILQQDRQVKLIRKRLVKKVLDTLKELKDKEPEEYKKFWEEFGVVLKEGIYSDDDNKDAILRLVLSDSTREEDEKTFIADYVERMKEGQDSIYYMTGNSLPALEGSPHLESFQDKGYEVLLFVDPVDEIWLQRPPAWDDLTFVSVSKGEVDLGTEEEKEKKREELETKTATFKMLLDRFKTELDADVKEVRLSNRLTNSPACLVVDQHDMTPQMEQLMNAMGQNVPHTKRILEVNPNHTIMAKLQDKLSTDGEDPIIADYAKLLYGQALLAEGGQLEDPSSFTRLMTELMAKAI